MQLINQDGDHYLHWVRRSLMAAHRRLLDAGSRSA
jgi:hypothetical protein